MIVLSINNRLIRVLKTLCLVSFFIILLLFAIKHEAVAQFQKRGYQATVIKVIDGDSIKVAKNKRTIVIRLYGIDAPEWKQPFSQKSKNYIRSVILGRKVWVESVEKDSYSREVAHVTINGVSVNEKLVEKGLAWVHIYYCKTAICEKWKGFEIDARSRKIGIWQDSNPVPPWVWKRKRRSDK